MTLIEVLVAIAVLGSAVTLLLTLLGLHGRNAQGLEANVFARILAENVMVAQLAARPGEDIGTPMSASFNNQVYSAEVTRVAAPIEGLELVRVDVVAEAGGRSLASIETLLPAAGTP